MSRRVVVEEPCPLHGEVDCRRYICDHPEDGKPHDLGHGACKVCPGGSRTVLEGIPEIWVQRAAKVLIEDKFKLRDEGMPIPNLVALNVLEAAVFGGSDVEG